MRAHLEEEPLERQEIYRLLAEAKEALRSTHEDGANVNTVVTVDAQTQYLKIARRILKIDKDNNLIFPDDINQVISSIRQSKTKATLRKYARAIRHASIQRLNILLNNADKAQREGNWQEVENIISKKEFSALTELSKLMPAEYTKNWQELQEIISTNYLSDFKESSELMARDYVKNWTAAEKRKSKKTSLSKLPIYWRELMVQESTGQFKIPMMVALMTGARPVEFEKGIQLKLVQGSLYVKIQGAKVKENVGQEYRIFKLADHDITGELIKIMQSEISTKLFVHINKGNSLTTHMRKVGEKLWPRRKESITCYTARHSMAAHCKEAIFKGADPDLVSQVLGHIVDKTASYYGNRFQSGGASVVPSDVQVPKPIKHISAQRNANRTLPSQKNKVKNTFKP
jgi:integrase